MSKKPWMGLTALVAVCSFSTVVIGQATAEDQAVAPSTQPKIVDLALSNGATSGIVVDDQGSPVRDAKVEVKYQGKSIAKVVTNDKGEFQVRKLRGGVHTIHSGRGVAVARFWAAASAPPAAKSRITVVSQSRLIRGQCGEFGCSVGCTAGGFSTGSVGTIVNGCSDGSCNIFNGWGNSSEVLYYDANCNPVYADQNFGGWGNLETALLLGSAGVIAGVLADDDDDAPSSP